MRKTLALLALLLVAAPVAADVVVIPYAASSAANLALANYQATLVKKHFGQFGVNCDVVQHENVRTSLLRTGSVMGKTYDLAVIVGFVAGSAPAASAAIFSPESLTRIINYATIPIVFVGRYNSGNMFTQSASCSTGLGANWLATAEQDSTHSAFNVTGPEVWKIRTARPMTVAATKPAGTWRAVIGYSFGATGIANVAEYQSFNPDGSVTRATFPDTVICAMRDMSSLSGYSAAKPLWFVSVGSGTAGTHSAMCQAFAHADSFSGRAIYTNKRYIPNRMAFLIRSGFKSGPGDFAEAAGGNYAMRVADSTNFKKSLDSLAVMGSNYPKRFTVTYEPESLSSFPYMRSWYDRLRMVKYAPLVAMGTTAGSGVSLAGNASATSPRDVFGISRSRIGWGGGTGTGADTGSVWFNARAAKQIGTDFFGKGNVEAALYPGNDDMVGASWKTFRDTAEAAIADAGYRAVFTNTDAINDGATIASRTNSPFYTPRAVSLRLARSDTSANSFRTRANGRTLNYLPIIAFSTIGPAPSIGVALDYADRCTDSAMFGTTRLDTYLPGAAYTNGVYDSKCYVCAIHASTLSYGETVGLRATHGYWHFKWAMNSMSTANQLAGRSLYAGSWPSDIDPRQP